MNRKKNVFFAHNEYHLLMSINIIIELYSNPEEYINRIYYAYKDVRYIDAFDASRIPANVIKLQLENNISLSSELEAILDFFPDCFFYFLEGRPINQFLVSKLHANGTKVCLVQDGLKPYGVVRKRLELLVALRETIKTYKVLRKYKLKLNEFHLFKNYQYGVTKQIDELWLSHPAAYINKFNKKIVPLPKLSKKQSDKRIFEFFLFNDKAANIRNWGRIVFYISTPLYNPDHVRNELTFLENLMQELPSNNGLLIKIHPLMEISFAQRYNRIKNVITFKSALPAELFILNLQNSIILSGWSTALLTNNPQCNFYYNYPIYKKDKLLSQFQPTNPTNHIKVIVSPNQINFPERP